MATRHKDHLGSLRVMTKLDKTVQDNMDYLPFGEQVAGSNSSTHKFTGHERDGESGLDYMGARYYTSLAGRFHSTDPIVVTSERLNDPQQLNLYAYVRNSPLVLIDPTGETLTISGNLARAKHELCAIIGGNCNNLTVDDTTNTITVRATEDEIQNNEGLALIRDLVSSTSAFDLFVGSRLETLAGRGRNDKDLVDVGHVKNLDNIADDRITKGDKSRPKNGIDSQVAFNPDAVIETDKEISNKLPAAGFTVVFHELAEAYARQTYKKNYPAAHREAQKREIRLREQRPYLRVHNPGAGPGDKEMRIRK